MVYIKELLPNPEGKDAGAEWIRIVNDGPEEVSLNGWSVSDASNNTYKIGPISIKPNEVIELGIDVTKISLNNGGDKITLYNQTGEEVDTLGYTETVLEGDIVLSPRLIDYESAGGLSASVIDSGSLIPQNTNMLLVGISIGLTFAVLFIYLSKHLMYPDE